MALETLSPQADESEAQFSTQVGGETEHPTAEAWRFQLPFGVNLNPDQDLFTYIAPTNNKNRPTASITSTPTDGHDNNSDRVD